MSVTMDTHSQDSVVVMATESVVVKVTPINDHQKPGRSLESHTTRSPRQSSSRSPKTRAPHQGIPQEERDHDLETWVEQTRMRHEALNHQPNNNQGEDLSVQAPLASMETLSDSAKCDATMISGCLPKGLENAGARLRSGSKSPKLTIKAVERHCSRSPRLIRQNAVEVSSSTESSRQVTQEVEAQCHAQPPEDSSRNWSDNALSSHDHAGPSDNCHTQSSFIAQSPQPSSVSESQQRDKGKLDTDVDDVRTSNQSPHTPHDQELSERSQVLQEQPPTSKEVATHYHLPTSDSLPHDKHQLSPQHISELQDPRASQQRNRAPPPAPILLPHPETDHSVDMGPPPPYTPPSSEDWKLIHVDFPPRCVDGGGILTTAVFETLE